MKTIRLIKKPLYNPILPKSMINPSIPASRYVFMSKTQLFLFVSFILMGVFSLSAQPNWKDITTVEALYNAYPDRVKFIFEQIDLNYEGLDKVKKNYDKGDWIEACHQLLAYYEKSSQASKFRNNPPRPSDMTIALADTILKNVFEVQNVKGKVPLLEDGHRDWYYKGPNNDNEWAWLSNRHDQLFQVFDAYRKTGNPKYVRYADEFLRDFIIKSWPYPAVKSSTSVWRGLEVSFRAKKWSEIFYSLLDNDNFQPATLLLMLSSLPEHAHYNRNFHAQKGNWLTMEISALATVSAYFPEYKLSRKWLEYAIEQMNQSMKEQVYPDGVQTELASHYHNVSLHNFQLFYDICQQVGLSLPQSYEQTLWAMYDYTAKIMRPDGSRILNNDSDRGNGKDDNRNIILNALKKIENPEWEYIATNGKSGNMPLQRSFFYPWAGQLISRSGYDSNAHWSFFDVGPWGSGHQHQDKLHLSISAFGTDFLVDAGRFAYRGKVADKFRPYARSSAAHNVVLIDDKNQTPGPLKADTPLGKQHYKIDQNHDYAFGSFDRFDQLEGQATHTRAFFYLKDQFWLVADRIQTDRPRNLKFLWHWHPRCRIQSVDNQIKAYNTGGRLTLIPLVDSDFEITEIKGREQPTIQGWYSPEYNLYEPNTLTQYETSIAGDQAFLWVLVPESDSSQKIKTKLLATTLSHFKIAFSLNDREWFITLPFENSDGVEVQEVQSTKSF